MLQTSQNALRSSSSPMCSSVGGNSIQCHIFESHHRAIAVTFGSPLFKRLHVEVILPGWQLWIRQIFPIWSRKSIFLHLKLLPLFEFMNTSHCFLKYVSASDVVKLKLFLSFKNWEVTIFWAISGQRVVHLMIRWINRTQRNAWSNFKVELVHNQPITILVTFFCLAADSTH